MTAERDASLIARMSRTLVGRIANGIGLSPFRQATTGPANEGVSPHPVSDLPVHGLDHVHSLSAAELREQFGGKAAGLMEMRQFGVPVPPGFVLGTELCRRFLTSGWPAGLDEAIEAGICALEQTTGLRLGDGEHPLLVSVRSGAAVSMPGMMDTVLNVGANRRTISALASRTQDERFAFDTWSRFSRMYASTVLTVPADALGMTPASGAAVQALRADVEMVHRLCASLDTPIPDDPRRQLRSAIEAVFRSSCSQRACAYREREGIDQDIPTAVVVQAMVFGNLGASSGTGVALTRNPSTGANEACGDFLINAQGEDVVAGVRTGERLEAMATRLPHVHRELLLVAQRLERHYRDLCDIEFTVQEGRLHILQVRSGKRSAVAAARIAVEMAGEGLITREEAVRRISGEQLSQLRSIAKVRQDAVPITSGVASSPGVASGAICLDPDRVATLAAEGHSVILVRPTTSPQDVHGMMAAAGIVTSTGGMACHAALVARGWGIPAVCGVASLAFRPDLRIAGAALREGDRLTIDGGTGAVYVGDCVHVERGDAAEIATLKRWANELGIPLGSEAMHAEGVPHSQAEMDEGTAAIDAFAVARALALLGFASFERLAASLVASSETVQRLIGETPDGHINRTQRGLQLSSEGRAWLQTCLYAERERTDRGLAERLYDGFMVLDARFKLLVTDWQMRRTDCSRINGDQAASDIAVREKLEAFHRDAMALMPEISTLAPRLDVFRRRFARAAAAIAAGDTSMIASPLKDSYHTIWFELHEELIHLSGRTRAAEEAKPNK